MMSVYLINNGKNAKQLKILAKNKNVNVFNSWYESHAIIARNEPNDTVRFWADETIQIVTIPSLQMKLTDFCFIT